MKEASKRHGIFKNKGWAESEVPALVREAVPKRHAGHLFHDLGSVWVDAYKEGHPEAQGAWLTGLMRKSHKRAAQPAVQVAPLQHEAGNG